MQSPARQLNFFQYYSIDVMFTLIAILATVLCFVLVICKWIYKKLFAIVVPKEDKRTNGNKTKQM